MNTDDAGRKQPPQAFPCEYVVVPVWSLDILFEDINRPWPATACGLWVQLYRARHQHEPWQEAPNARMLAGMAGITIALAQEHILQYDLPLLAVSDAGKVRR